MQAYSLNRAGIFTLAVVLAAGLLLGGCARPNPAPNPGLIQSQTPRPVILDVDMAHDDMFASLFLLSHPNVDVRAITVAGTGEAHCGPGVSNALGLLVLTGQDDVPVACGRDVPLAGDHEFPSPWRQGADIAYGVEIPAGGEASALGAADLIIDTLKSSDEKISIVAVGPLTNIAEALEKAPEISAKIEKIYIMGGAVATTGNVGVSGVGIQNDYAEWNIYIDPAAANIVFNSGVPVILVPLDATRDVPVTRKFYEALGENQTTPAAKLVYNILTANLDFIDSGGFQFWDSLTAAIFTDEGLASFEDVELVVVVEEGPESGRTKLEPGGAQIKVASGANRMQFEQLFLTILNREN